MTILFIRLRPERTRGISGQVTHLITAPTTTGTPPTLTAFCGAIFAPGEAELLAWFDGMPCTACALAAAPHHGGSSVPPIGSAGRRDHVSSTVARQRRQPVRDRPSSGSAAVGLRDERLVHRVPDRPLVSTLDGRTVVLARCGMLAWTTNHEPPSEWPRCSECVPTVSADRVAWRGDRNRAPTGSDSSSEPVTDRAAPPGREVGSA